MIRQSWEQRIRRTTVYRKHNWIETEGTAETQTITQNTRTINEEYKRWLYYQVYSSEEIGKVIEDIKRGTAISVSDGSYVRELELGTTSWIIESEAGDQFIRGICIVPGAGEIQSA